MKPIVVVIDSGIDSKIVNNVTMDVLKKGEEDKCGHGTACAMIIKSIDMEELYEIICLYQKIKEK